jgi:hypothetical protein
MARFELLRVRLLFGMATGKFWFHLGVIEDRIKDLYSSFAAEISRAHCHKIYKFTNTPLAFLPADLIYYLASEKLIPPVKLVSVEAVLSKILRTCSAMIPRLIPSSVT